MNADEIRAKAIERVARSEYERWARNCGKDWTFDGCDWPLRNALLDQATHVVDALGDMLPTGAQERGGHEVWNWQGETTRRIPRERLWTHDWQTIESDAA
ncbi:hypothetical protein ACFRAQ_36185 [Nocardia sp. NPDC056611]|uniref:hypothetical protein n=1 Tax=Nocardia sp. NPDC056611 TaxID=3345877 RepID=UPI00366E8DA1